MRPIWNITSIILLLSFPATAQKFTPLKDPVPSSASFLQLGNQIVLIHPFDKNNSTQKWVTFDSGLNIIAAKKIFSPEWHHMVSQNYVTTSDAVIRIDQMIFNDSLYITLYRFDASGNLRKRLALDFLPFNGRKLETVPFYISQSADKKMLALVQPMTLRKDELTLTSFVLNEMLDVSSNFQRAHPFDPLLHDMLLPLVDNDGKLFVPITEKFDSYRLGSLIQLVPLHNHSDPVQFTFDRKKLKDARMQLSDGRLTMSALYSVEQSKSDIAGILQLDADIKDIKKQQITYHLYNDELKKSLVKKTGNAMRKGNPFNYLFLLPAREKETERTYGVLLSDQMPLRIQNNNTPVANASEELDNVKRQVAAVNSLTGTRRRGQTLINPMTPAEASVYAATMQRTVGNESRIESTASSLPPAEKEEQRELLQFTYLPNSNEVSYQLLRIRLTNDLIYDFFSFAEVRGQYHAIQYKLPTLKRAQLTSSTFGADGKPVEMMLLEDKNRVIVNGYPTLLFQGRKLVAVYADRYTGEMGVVGVELQ
jgi:hypothetical protein